ncbi:MAG: type II toxin-antitoxin system RelE/ParE family toxin [Oceanospirillaceae bacterium]
MIESFKDKWLADYYWLATHHRLIQSTLESSLRRKLDLIHVASAECDLRSPPGNRFEHLTAALLDCYSIRVNKQYRLIFKWENGKATSLYLDPPQILTR